MNGVPQRPCEGIAREVPKRSKVKRVEPIPLRLSGTDYHDSLVEIVALALALMLGFRRNASLGVKISHS